MEERLHKGDIVQHFKRTMKDYDDSDMTYVYIIVDVAEHTETKEKLVIYKALYNNDETGVHYGTYARPYNMFMSEVDQEKYPDVKQKYRFEVTPFTERIKKIADEKFDMLRLLDINLLLSEREMDSFLKDVIKESKESTYINSIPIENFTDINSLNEFVKEANKNGLGVHMKYETSNLHQGILVQVYDIGSCECKDMLDK